MQMRRYQTGLGALSWLVVLGLGVFLLTCLFKVGPVYLDYWSTKKSLESALDSGNTASLSKSGLIAAIGKQLDVDRIESISAKDIQVIETREGRQLDASYEKRVELIGNIDVVVKFDKLIYPLPQEQ